MTPDPEVTPILAALSALLGKTVMPASQNPTGRPQKSSAGTRRRKARKILRDA